MKILIVEIVIIIQEKIRLVQNDRQFVRWAKLSKFPFWAAERTLVLSIYNSNIKLSEYTQDIN